MIEPEEWARCRGGVNMAELRDYFEEDQLLDGSPVFIRAIRPEDREALHEGIRQQSDESIWIVSGEPSGSAL